MRRPRLRQAVGVFYEAGRLQQTLDTLTMASIDLADLAILARREAIDTNLRPHLEKMDSGVLRDLLQEMIVVGPVSQAGPLFISRGHLAEFLSRTSKDEGMAKPFPGGHLSDRHSAFLQDQLDAGACLLWVTIRNGDDEKTAGAALLRHSRHQVQMRDFVG
ncbi:MAG: hypothetical protein ACR2QF_01705 [Geminicoccaceae bacterium]